MTSRAFCLVMHVMVWVVLAGCHSQSSPTTPESPAPARLPPTAEPTPPAAPFFVAEPLLDGLQPDEPWAFRQETWSGASPQHCYELGYPQRLSADILRETNAKLVARGIPGKLPETVRVEHLVFAFVSEWNPGIVAPREPLAKLLLCTEGVAARTDRDRVVARLLADPRARELPFGEPRMAWHREHEDHRKELGFLFANVTREQASQALVARGYTESRDEAKQTLHWRGDGVAGRMPGSSELWWSAVQAE